jgi:uncharacterized protein with ATP-grasp and redox domains
METVKFTDPDTQEVVEFVVEEETQLNGNKYLLVSENTEEQVFDAYILKEIKDEKTEVTYAVVEDEVEFLALARIFTELSDEDTDIEY